MTPKAAQKRLEYLKKTELILTGKIDVLTRALDKCRREMQEITLYLSSNGNPGTL